MTKARKALWVAVPTAALLIGGGVGIAAAVGGPPTAPVTGQVVSTVQDQQQAPGNGDQIQLRDQDQLRDGTCDPTGVQTPDRDQVRDQMHDPIQDRDRLHDGTCDR